MDLNAHSIRLFVLQEPPGTLLLNNSAFLKGMHFYKREISPNRLASRMWTFFTRFSVVKRLGQVCIRAVNNQELFKLIDPTCSKIVLTE